MKNLGSWSEINFNLRFSNKFKIAKKSSKFSLINLKSGKFSLINLKSGKFSLILIFYKNPDF